MASAKFQPVNQSGDAYGLDNLSREPLRSAHYTDYSDHGSQPPTRWYSKKSHVTYVTAPDDEFAQPQRRRTKDTRRSSRLSFLANPVSNFRIPTFAAPWQHEVTTPPFSHKAASTVRRFSPSKQWQRLFVNGLSQWSVTVVIVLGLFGTLYGFGHMDVLTRGQKYTFNAIITLLSLCLGLAVVAALRAYARLLTWRFLASGYRNLQDFELVMNCESQMKVVKLLWAGRTPGRFGLNKTQLLCMGSIFLVIGLQIAIGLLGLTYSIDTSSAWLSYEHGNVSIVDLTNIYQDSSYNVTSVADKSGAANYFGLVGQHYFIDYYPVGQGIDGQEAIYTADNKTYFYNFVDTAPPDPKAATTAVSSSERYVTVDASCVELQITKGGFIDVSTATTELDFKDQHGNNQRISVVGNSVTTSTYMSNSSRNSNCGPRCTSIYILDTGYQPSASSSSPDNARIDPHLYICNSTVSKVFKSNECLNEFYCTLNDENARYLAGSIGFTGETYENNFLQYKTYPPGSPWSWDGAQDYNNASFRAQEVAKFTANAIAAMDSVGPRVTVEGDYPVPAVALTVEWHYAIPVLCTVPGVQLVVLLLVCLFANGALIMDGGKLSTAHLLKPVVDKLGDHGCALTSDEIARELGNFQIVYGVRAPAGRRASTSYSAQEAHPADFHVGVIARDEGFGAQPEEGWRPTASFPPGNYDGPGYEYVGSQTKNKVGRKRRLRIVVEEESDDEHDGNEKTGLLTGADYV